MGKIRIYELARELNMTNKELLRKLEELDIPVKSHMSSVDDETVAEIKAKLRGKKQEDMEETRVRPTVIRRRRIKTPEKPVVAETSPEEAAEEDVAPEEPVEAAASTETAAPAEPAEPTETPEKAEAAVPDEPEAPAEPAGPEAEAETAAGAVDETVATNEGAVAEALEIEAEASESEVNILSDNAELKPVDTPTEATETVEEQAAAPPKEAPAAAKKTKPLKPTKKFKKETPAKIIQLPVKPPEPPPETAELDGAATQGPARGEADKDASAKDKKKKGRKGKVEEVETERKFLKKKISFRKKEVIEGKDLYGAPGKRGRKLRKGAKVKLDKGQKTQITTPKAIKRRIKIDETIILAELAKRMGIKANEMIAKLMSLGVMATVNQTIDFETATLVSNEFGYELEKASFEEEAIIKEELDAPENLAGRPPVVTIMGHVDHGKTSLLDVIRKTRVTEGEAGGITQHIGAYNVSTPKGQVVFLDTPGHEAFSAMRSRGAKITDIVVLVVAADDGVMPQTIEAINHSKAAKVPIIVAVNKIDKDNADPDRVLRELAEQGLVPEDWGGDTIFVKVSAKKNIGIDDLLEMLLLQAEMLELKANPDKLAKGHVVEAKLDAGRGPVATVLVQEGTLHAGDPVVCGIHYGKIRALLNDRGAQVNSAGPSIPVEIIGLSGVPLAGDEFISLAEEKDAKQISLHRSQKQRSIDLAKTSRLSLEGLFEKMQVGEVKDLNLILKADVHGSIEALKDSLSKLSNEEVKINVVHSATGAITESDISLAAVSDAIIVGFNVRPSSKLLDMASEEHVDIRYYNVIYDVIKEIRDAMLGLMSSTFEDRTMGWAEVRDVFHIPKIGAIAGCYVTDGKFERGKQVRLLRDGVVVYDGKISSLRRFKDDVKEVQSGYECGIGVENFNDIKINDTLECYYIEEIRPELD